MTHTDDLSARFIHHLDEQLRASGLCTIRLAGRVASELSSAPTGNWGFVALNACLPPLTEPDRQRVIERYRWRQAISAGIWPRSLADELLPELAWDFSDAIEALDPHHRGGQWNQLLRMRERAILAEISVRAKGMVAA